ATAVDEGIIAGRPDNTFGAGDNATRAEAATMAVKMLEAPGN
ncbi:MAG: S-layer homology domain-containing protein, partial [Firmicutes bacterium]|nr:S-layer homology domain-containing protein [Bacillota bacterium]